MLNCGGQRESEDVKKPQWNTKFTNQGDRAIEEGKTNIRLSLKKMSKNYLIYGKVPELNLHIAEMEKEYLWLCFSVTQRQDPRKARYMCLVSTTFIVVNIF